MALTNFPNGISSFGVPVLPSVQGGASSGSVFWVDSGGNNGSKGTFARPFATLDEAFASCTANNGDIIYVKEGHAETISTAAGIAHDVAGVTVVGLGVGSARPTFTFDTAAGADYIVSAANARVFNLVFLGNLATLTSCFTIAGDSCEVAYCEFRESTNGMLAGLTIGAADGDSDYAYVHHNVFYMDEPGVTNAGDGAIEIVFDSDHIRIWDNYIYGDFDDAGIHVPAAGNACDFLSIQRNYVENTAATYAIEVTTGGTMNGGDIVDNRLVSSNAAEILQPHTLQCLGNLGNLGETGAGDFPVPGYQLGERGARVVRCQTGSMATGFGTADDPALFTVTGVVAARVWGVVTTAITSTGGTGTLSVGVADNNALLVPAITMDATNGAQYDVLSNATTTVNGDVLETGGQYAIIANGVDIQAFIATNNMTAGAVDFYCEWYPISAGASVVSAI